MNTSLTHKISLPVRSLSAFVYLSLGLQAVLGQTQSVPAENDSARVEQRVESYLKQMTLAEKIDYIGGFPPFSVRAIPRLGLPEIRMADGPMGCRGSRDSKPSTSYGAGVALAATWDSALARKMGGSMGRDCRARGFNVLYGPGLNMSRSPLCGRNFEYMGEDPCLAGQMASHLILGLKDEGVLGCVKHFAANNQEWDRAHISDEVDERTLREIYLPAFETAVKQGHAQAVMSAYNLINGVYCSENAWLLIDVLKKGWGFQGFVVSDWNASHDAKRAALGGLDLEMPKPDTFSPTALLPLVENKTIPIEVIDDKVRRLLRTFIAAGFFDRPQLEPDIPLDDPKSNAVALEGARASTVLLKNDGNLLPLNLNVPQTILVVGPNATPAVFCGSGSGFVKPFHAVSVLDGIKAIAPKAAILTHPGLQSSGTPDKSFLGEETLKTAAESADVIIACVGFGQSADTNSAHLPFNPGWPQREARALGIVESEESDRPFALPAAQVETMRRLAALHKKMVVVLNAGAGVDPAGWLDQAPALLCAWYPGQEGGTAIAEIITGAVNPSAKLPVTFAKRYEDYPAAPYYQINTGGKTPYTEGLNVGYRGFDALQTEPLFCFGYGLSYTAFKYDGLTIEPSGKDQVKVSFSITNTGQREGAEVAEVYVTPAAGPISRPPKELKGFAKVLLKPGESQRVESTLDNRAFAYWSTEKNDWVVDPGTYGVLIGASSRDIRLQGTIAR